MSMNVARQFQMPVQIRRALVGAVMLCLPLMLVMIIFDLAAGVSLQRTLTLMMINMIAVVGIGLFSGNSGILSFGHVAFMGLGAYISGILTVPIETKAITLSRLPEFLKYVELPLFPALIVTLAVILVVSLIVGLPVFRLDGASAVIGTLGVLLIFHGILIGAVDFTRGADAFLGVRRVTDLWTAGSAALVAIILARMFRDTVVGLRLRASRDDQVAASASGISVRRVRLVAWVASAVLCGLSGALLGHFLGAFSPSKFYFDDTLTLLTMLIVGGMATISGAVLGTIVVTLVVEILRRVEGGVEIFGFMTPEAFGLTQAGLCVLILAVMYVRPAGIIPRLELDELFHAWIGKSNESVAKVGRSGMKANAGRSITVSNAVKDFAGLRALDHVNLELETGEIVGLIGPNGSGKTTLLNTMSGVLALTAGEIRIGKTRINGATPEAFCKAGVGRTFQNIRLFDTLSVIENVEAAATTHWPSISQSDARQRARQLLEQMNLSQDADRAAATLDYGAQRRLEIARALALRPDFLLLDEPAAGMNPTESASLFNTLSKLREEYGFGLMVIDHDLKLIMRLCDRIIVLNKGQVIASGLPSEIQKDPDVIEAYIGRKRATEMARANN